MTVLSLDWETRSELDLKKVGLDRYSAHPSTRVLMAAYSFDTGKTQHWDAAYGPLPAELAEALADPEVEKRAFNAQFERVITRRVLKIKTPVKNWRCTMVLAYMQSFTGNLEMIGRQVGLPIEKQKLSTGTKLIRLFCGPQKVSKRQPFLWRDELTNPVEWEEFCDYNVQDNETEKALWNRLCRFPVLEDEWELYELDQVINDRGLPIDMRFVRNAIEMTARRKAELAEQMREISGLANPNSPQQLLPWLQKHGYPFGDLQKDTIKKVLTMQKEGAVDLDEDTVDMLNKRRQSARTSTAKYTALANKIGDDDRFRFGFQFGGASRTNRWSGRTFQPHNLTRTPKELESPDHLEEDYLLNMVTETIRDGDYDGLDLMVKEPMDALAGTVRSAIRVHDEEEEAFCVSDLASIESCTIGWVSGCERLLNVFRNGLDAYKDFGTTLYSKPYSEITKTERTNSKPAVLGAGYRLGGGDLKEGKRTGLWGYAESMGINLTKEESHRAVKLFREGYPEIPKLWYALEDAFKACVRTGRTVVPVIRIGERRFEVPVKFEYRKPYLIIWLPTGRPLYYHLPRVQKRTVIGRDGTPYEKDVLSYMGQPQGTKIWARIETHGGKITENIVQALARDILKWGMKRATAYGFKLVGHVHDELIALIRRGDNRYTLDALRRLMAEPVRGCEGLPLGSAGWTGAFYKKD